MTAYYNEFDPKAAAWLRELIRRGLIADGVVDERSILDVEAIDLIGFTQCHFFAGIGGWSYALRLAGWPDDRPVWTGSPPCQPFSSAGAQKGQDDERHLAPHFAKLIADGRPPILFGEQVASAAVFGKVAKRAGGPAESDAEPEWAWLDDLSDRLEAAHYAVGASDLPAASVGAPHIRQRTFFGAVDLERVDDPAGARYLAARVGAEGETRGEARLRGPERGRGAVGLADAKRLGRERRGASEAGRRASLAATERRGYGVGVADAVRSGQSGSGLVGRPGDPAPESDREVDRAVHAGRGDGLADAPASGRREECQDRRGGAVGDRAEGRAAGHGPSGCDSGLADSASWSTRDEREQRSGQHGFQPQDGSDVREGYTGSRLGPVGRESGTDAPDSPWGSPDWLFCRDGKWRPVESGAFPLAHGVSARVGRLRGYGNAIVPQAAAVFIEAFCGALTDTGPLRLTEASEITADILEVFG